MLRRHASYQRTPRAIMPCIDACFRVPLLYTALGDRLSALYVTCAIEKKEVRAKYLRLDDPSEVAEFRRGDILEVRPP